MLIGSSAHIIRPYVDAQNYTGEIPVTPSSRKEGSVWVRACNQVRFNGRTSFKVLCLCFIFSSFTVFIAPHPSRFLRVGSTMSIKALRIGIETEVLLRAKRMEDQCKSCSQDFAQSLVDYYNSKVCRAAGLAEMRYSFDLSHASDDPTYSTYWTVTEDGSIDLTEGHYRHLRSPSMRPCEEILAPSPSCANAYCARGSRIRITYITLRYHQLMAPETALAFSDYSELR